MYRRVTTPSLVWMLTICTAAVWTAAGAASAADAQPFGLDPSQAGSGTPLPANLLLAQAPAEQPAVPATQKSETVEEKPGLPISFGLTYALYSDYWWRGFNFSEFDGEGREKPNHQLTVWFEFDLGDFGRIGYSTWFEWYAAQKQLNPDFGGQNCQEVDYTVYYAYTVEQITTDVTLGMNFYEYLNLARELESDKDPGNNNDDRSVDIYLTLEHDDAWMWKWLLPNNEEGVLNPSFLIAQDVGSITGTWMEWGISHDFAIPGIDNLTITPGYKLLAQCNYWLPGFFLAGDVWSLSTTYDLTPVLKLPEWAGTVTVGGELYFYNAYGQLESTGTTDDHFWGGMTVNWSWGG